jgi:hypothetical protein
VATHGRTTAAAGAGSARGGTPSAAAAADGGSRCLRCTAGAAAAAAGGGSRGTVSRAGAAATLIRFPAERRLTLSLSFFSPFTKRSIIQSLFEELVGWLCKTHTSRRSSI